MIKSRLLAVTVLVAALVVGSAAPALAKPPVKTPTITSKPSSITNQTSATFAFSYSVTGATFTCSLDGAKAKACTSPKTYTGLNAGQHTFSVRAVVSGRSTKPANYTWTVDLTPPAAPSVVAPTSPNNKSSVNVSFSPSVVPNDVVGYLCSLNGAAFASCTSPAAVSTPTDGVYSFAVKAVDAAGNASTARTVGWLRDTVAPVPVVTSGPPSPTSATSATFTFSSPEAGSTFKCSLDGGAYAACTSPKTYSPLSNGGHTFAVQATDLAGNVGTSSTYAWTVNSAFPVSLSWTSTPASIGHVASASFGFTTSGATGGTTCSLDSASPTTCASPVGTGALSDGSHTFSVTATNGTVTTTLTYAWTIDTTAPLPAIVNGPSGTVPSTSAAVTAAAAEPGDVLTCFLDGSAATCASLSSLTGLSQGAHTVTVRATDAADNSTQTAISWTVDTVGPVATVTTPSSVSGPVAVAFDENVTGIDATSVLLQLSGSTTVATARTCATGAGQAVSCGSGVVRRVTLQPTQSLVPGQSYQVLVAPGGATSVTDAVGNVASPVTTPFTGQVLNEETSAANVVTWRKVTDKAAKGRSYLTEHNAGAAVTWRFTGSAFTWVTLTGPTYGWATVYVDGLAKLSFNGYATRVHHGVTRTIKALTKKAHVVKIVVKGKKGNRHGKGTFVAVDAFKVGKKLTASPVVTASWRRATVAGASGHGYGRTDLKRATASFTFVGTGADWVTTTGPTFGKVAVYVDGTKTGVIDNWSAKTTYQVTHSTSVLPPGTHTVKLVVLGSKRARAKGSYVAVDSWLAH
jgi:hypothetical protein